MLRYRVSAMNKAISRKPSRTPASVNVQFVVEPEARTSVRLLGAGWRQSFAATFRKLWDAEQPGRGGEIGIVLVGTERIRELNRDFRWKDRPTDVLSFDLSESAETIEAEVYVSAEVARRRAERAGCPFSEEVARLMIHGLLHLAGHNHHTSTEGRRMAAASRRWLGRWYGR